MLETALFGSPDGTGTRWRLMGIADDLARSRHYVRMKFDIIGGQLQGALVAWNTDEEIPLVDVRFDGIRLSLRLPGTTPRQGVMTKTPRLSLVLSRDREFRGYYVDELNRRLDPDHELKLVKIDEEVSSL